MSYRLLISVSNTTSEYLTLNDVTGLANDNMFLTNLSAAVQPHTTWPVAGNIASTGSMLYNITEEMLLQIQWTKDGSGDKPKSFSAGVVKGTEYETACVGPDISSDGDMHDYLYTVTLSKVTSADS